MRILLAPNAFKGALSAYDAASAMAEGFARSLPNAELILHPIADGGDGTADLLTRFYKANRLSYRTVNALGAPITANYGLSNDGKTAYLDLAEASGIRHLEQARNPTTATTYGTGLMLAQLARQSISKIFLGLGGSASIDGGAGILEGLGYKFYDKAGNSLSIAQDQNQTVLNFFERIDKVVPPDMGAWEKMELYALWDVANPVLGERGCVKVFGEQKGVSKDEFSLYEKGLINWAYSLNQEHLLHLAGYGTAGGVSLGLSLIPGIKFFSGADYLFDLWGMEEKIKSADWVMTGEGSFDNQSLDGKCIGKLLELCKKWRKPCVIMAGQMTGLIKEPLLHLYPIGQNEKSMDEAMSNTAKNLSLAASELATKLLRS